MSTEDHRAAYAAQVKSNGGPSGASAEAWTTNTPDAAGAHGTIAMVRSRETAPDTRVAAIDRLRHEALSRDGVVRDLINVLGDRSDDPAVRRAALGALQELTFLAAAFAPHAADYRAALRTAASDADPELRDRALEILALEKDEYAQRLLVDGLRDDSAALVNRTRALQLLGQDTHAQDHDLVRGIAENATDPAERLAALRVLGTDSRSAPLFRRILLDKEETKDARATSVAALQSLDPEDFSGVAQEIVLDPTDYEDVRALSLTALAVRPGATAPDLADRVFEAAPGATPALEEAARHFRRSQETADE